MSKAEEDFLCYAEPEDVLELQDYKIREDILAKCTTDAQVRTYFAASGAAAMKKHRTDQIVQEAMHRPKIKIFGNERLGLQSYVQLKRTMITTEISSKCSVKK